MYSHRLNVNSSFVLLQSKSTMSYGGAVGGSSLYKGSEEGFDYECDPCKVDEAIKEARHFCPVCQEYLCDDCRHHHRKMRATKSHKILSGKDMPKKAGPTRIMKPQDICACGQNVADFYCETHKEVFCVTCKTVRHRSCNVEALDNIIQSKTNLQQFNKAIDELKELRTLATETESLQDTLLESLAANENTCKERIRVFRRDINALLDQLEGKTTDDLKGRCIAQKIALTDRKAVCRNIKDKLDADFKTAIDIRNANDPRDIFIQNLLLSQTLTVYRNAVNDAKLETTLKEISFEKEPYLVGMHIHAKQLGNISGEMQQLGPQNVFLKATVDKKKEYSLKPPASKINPISFAGVFLTDGNLIVSDYANRMLVMLDSNMQIIRSIIVPLYPWDITEISEKEIVCSHSYNRQLQFVEVSPAMKLKNNIKLNAYCFGITYFKDNIYVYCDEKDKTELQIMTKDGTLQKVVHFNDCRDRIGTEAGCLGTNKDGSRLYLSDFSRRSLTCMETNGDTIFAYNGSDIRKPRGVIVDDDDNFIVCDQEASIKVFKSDGSFYRHLIDVSNPIWLAWRKTDNTLVVWNGTQLIAYAINFD